MLQRPLAKPTFSNSYSNTGNVTAEWLQVSPLNLNFSADAGIGWHQVFGYDVMLSSGVEQYLAGVKTYLSIGMLQSSSLFGAVETLWTFFGAMSPFLILEALHSFITVKHAGINEAFSRCLVSRAWSLLFLSRDVPLLFFGSLLILVCCCLWSMLFLLRTFI